MCEPATVGAASASRLVSYKNYPIGDAVGMEPVHGSGKA